MLLDWTSSFLISLATGLLVALTITLISSRIARRKVRKEWQIELDKVRLEGQLEATDRANEIATTLAQYQAEQARAVEVVARTLVGTTQENYGVLAIQTNKLDHLVLVIDGICLSTDRLEKLFLTQIELFAARAQSAAAIVVLQEAKDQFSKELIIAKQEILELKEKLKEI